MDDDLHRWADDGGPVADEPEQLVNAGFNLWYDRTFVVIPRADGDLHDLVIFPGERFPLALHPTQAIELGRRLIETGRSLL